MTGDATNQYTLYKSNISYFSGKMEAYLRYQSIPYHAVDCNLLTLQYIGAHTGVQKMPALEATNGQWLYDTTPMLQWFDKQSGRTSIFPQDPAFKFLTLLIEDYADEWLWRPAMWWRWMPPISSRALGRMIASEFIHPIVAAPIGWFFKHRQRYEWLWGDGMSKHNSNAIRDMLYDEFAFLEPLLNDQPYLLGSHPSAADFGYFASMYRHFSNDPESAEVMRRQAPNTYEWVARMWNIKPEKLPQEQTWQWPEAEHWQALLGRIANDYLPYLHQNALAFKAGKKRFNYSGEKHVFNNTQTTHYRVWCREKLQAHFAALNEQEQSKINALFEAVGGLGHLHTDGIIESGLDRHYQLPITPKPCNNKRYSWFRYWLGQPRN